MLPALRLRDIGSKSGNSLRKCIRPEGTRAADCDHPYNQIAKCALRCARMAMVSPVSFLGKSWRFNHLIGIALGIVLGLASKSSPSRDPPHKINI